MDDLEIATIKLITGELLVGICVSVDENGVGMWLPYELKDNCLYQFCDIVKMPGFAFLHKDIMFFKEIKDEVKEAYFKLVLEENTSEFEEYFNRRKTEIELRKEGRFTIEDGSTMIH